MTPVEAATISMPMCLVTVWSYRPKFFGLNPAILIPFMGLGTALG